MTIVYTHSVPLTVGYPNISHFLTLRDIKPSKIYVNFWDNFVLEHPVFERISGPHKLKTLNDNIDSYEKIILSLGAPFESLIYTEASSLLLRDKDYYNILQQILSQITTENLLKGIEIRGWVYKEITISNILNIIIDYLIAVFIESLYPKKNFHQPDIYFSSERFKLFYPIVEEVLKKEVPGVKLPQPFYISFPFIQCPKSNLVPSVGMNYKKIYNIIRNYFEKEDIKKFELEKLINCLTMVLPNFKFKDSRINKDSFIRKLKICNKDMTIKLLTQSFMDYYSRIEKIIFSDTNRNKETIIINDIFSFEEKIKPLNNLKLKILSLCNGDLTSLEIARALKLKLSTVSAYISQFKNKGLVTNEKRPKRIADNIIFNLGDMHLK